jgi:hypothetical protein
MKNTPKKQEVNGLYYREHGAYKQESGEHLLFPAKAQRRKE